MIKLYRKLRKWWFIVVLKAPVKGDICQDCVDEARAYCGIYSRNESVPDNKLGLYDKSYDNEYYFAHLDPWGWNAKVKVR